MSSKLRGEEVALNIAVDGVIQNGSLIKVTSFTATPRTDINEDDYLGEQETDLDIQHHGWDVAFEFDHQDAVGVNLTEEIIDRETSHDQHPEITITAIYNYRQPGARAVMMVYNSVTLKCTQENVGGRKEKVKGKFEGKCKTRSKVLV